MNLRVAVLGFGSIGRRHFVNLRTLGIRNITVFDPFTPLSLGNTPCFSELEELWMWQPNVAFITSPTRQHTELSLEAARRNCHLFIEKPLSYTHEGLAGLKSEVETRNLTNMVGCNMRFHPAHSFLHAQLQRKAVGEIVSARFYTGSYLPSWRPGTDYRASYSADGESGGAILDCIHELDLALWHLGTARLVGATHRGASSLGLQTEGVAELLLRHQGGVISSVHLNFVQRDYWRGFEIVGDRGTLRWNWQTARVERCGEDGKCTSVFEIDSDWQTNQMYLDEIAVFLNSIYEGKVAPNGLEEAEKTLSIAMQAREIGNN